MNLILGLCIGIVANVLVVAGIIIALHIVFAQLGQLLAWRYKVEWFQDKPYKYMEIYITTALVWALVAWRCYELWLR